MSAAATSGQAEETSLVDALARDAEEVFEFLKAKGPPLEGFRREYMELQASLETLLDNVSAKEREVEAQNAELNQVRDQLNNSRRAIDDAQVTKETLQANIDHIQASRRNLIDREVSNRSEISIYSGQFEELKSALAAGSGWTHEQEEDKHNYEKTRDFLTKKLENKTNLVNGVRSDVDKLYGLIQQAESHVAEIDQRIEDKNNEIKHHNKRSSDQKLLSESLEVKIRELQQAISAAEKELDERNKLQQGEDKTLSDLENSLNSSKARMEEYLRGYDALVRTTMDLTAELERHTTSNIKAAEDLIEREKYITEKEAEITSISKETAKVIALKEIAARKLEEIEKEKHEIEIKKDMLTKKIETARDVDLRAIRKESEANSKQQSTLKKEIDILKKRFDGSERAAKTMDDLMHVNQNAKRNLSIEKKLLLEQVAQQQEQIQQLLHEKDRHELEAETTNQQYYTSLEELKLQELQVRELQKKTIEDQAKLKQKQNLYEAVRSDRNLYSKQLVESQEEINGLKRKFRLMNHQIEQLKEEISAKDHAIVKEHFHHHTVDKERELLKNELTKIRKQVSSSEQIIENQQIEVLKLSRIIEEADQERQQEK